MGEEGCPFYLNFLQMYTLGEGGSKHICGLDHSGSETFKFITVRVLSRQ